LYDEFLKAMLDHCNKVTRSYALALKLSTDLFEPITRKAICVGQLAYYPAVSPDLIETDKV
jgi:isopenicillin N synthase-like dioxygenase